jgi:hypothetical protein
MRVISSHGAGTMRVIRDHGANLYEINICRYGILEQANMRVIRDLGAG